MPINQLYNTWKMWIRQLKKVERKTRISYLARLIVGIYKSRLV